MNPDQYLEKVLDQQTFKDDDSRLKDLREERNRIDKILRLYFWDSSPSIRWAGSMAKGTMIIASYDGDMTCYFPEDEEKAGKTLAEISTSVKEALQDDYSIEVKASALRVKSKESCDDLHIDVVPGRYVDESKSDVFLHRTKGDKSRLKTNLQKHIDHIKDSGFQSAIRLMKLWKVRNGIESAKTFVLELLVVKLLQGQESLSLSSQLEHIWTKFRDDANNLLVEDPANSNNDLKPILDECRNFLSSVASSTLWQIEHHGWEQVFGELEDEENQSSNGQNVSALNIAVASVITPTKPWGGN
ncbi:hypothetical protein Lepto7375DRAFT_6790 [Leptolyngbya sp. PCC 7375]|nr:hypothetical protein Lepto7375DRAFT_6790 [Leptolyngbya sp. PCC 7375]